jgi:acyl-CoA synthetase (AMP-forming)/AMP-acid ligase II
MCPQSAPADRRAVSVARGLRARRGDGCPVASTESRVVDPETGRDVEPGKDGGIWVRWPQVMRRGGAARRRRVGEVPRAFVVLKGATTAEAWMRHVAERVAPYKKVRRVDFIDAIPKSPSGKILRRLSRDRPIWFVPAPSFVRLLPLLRHLAHLE